VLDDKLPRVGQDLGSANEGRFVHALLSDAVHPGNNGLTSPSDAYLKNSGIDPERREDIVSLAEYGYRKWRDFETYMPNPMLEQAVEAALPALTVKIKGTIDLLSITPETVYFIDWKSGRRQYGHYHQMAGYAYALRQQLGLNNETLVKGIVVYLRDRRYRVYDFNADSSSDWATNLTKNVLSQPSAVTKKPGEYCRFCELYSSCDARQTQTHAIVDDILSGQPDRTKNLLANINTVNKYTPEIAQAVEDALFRLRLLERTALDTRNLLKKTLQKVGAMPLLNNTVLTLQERRFTKIVTEKAWRLLKSRLSEGELIKAATLSKTNLLGIYKRHFDKKDQSDAVNDMIEMLRSAEATEESVITAMSVVDMTPNELLEQENQQRKENESHDHDQSNE
jgi:hypothetical protein